MPSTPESRKLQKVAARTALLYVLLGAAWIFYSEKLLDFLAPDRETVNRWGTYKGWAFIIVTGLLLYLTLRRQLARWASERGKVEEAAASRLALEAQFSKLAETVPGVIHSFRLAPDGTYRFEYMSQRTEELCGLTREQILANPEAVIALIHPEDLATIYPFTPNPSLMDRRELRLRHPQRGELWLEVQSRAEVRPDGSTIWHGISLDITARRLAERQASEATALLRAVVDHTPDVIFVKDRAGHLLLVNQAAATLLDRPVEDLLGRADHEVLDADLAARIRAVDLRVLASGQAEMAEEAFTIAGSPRVFLTAKAPFRDASGATIGTVGVSRDITRRKEAERALAESEERLRLATRAARLGTYDWDVARDEIHWSDEHWQYVGYQPQPKRVDFRFFAETVHPEDRERVVAQVRVALATGAPFAEDFRIVRRTDGAVAWVSSTGRVLLNESGQPYRMIGVIVDITERKRAEEQLRLFRTLLDQSDDTVEVVDPATGRFLDVNTRGHERLGYTREEFLQLHVLDVDPQPGVEWASLAAHLRSAEVLRRDDLLRRRKDGSTFPIEVRIRRVALEREYFVAVVRDITARKEMEQQLLRTQRMESIGTLASGIAHDLNNVLTPIILSLDTLRERQDDDETRPLLDTMAASAERGAAMVNQVLSFARGIAGQRIPVRVEDLIAEVTRIARDTFLKNLEVTTVTPAGLWSVIGDPTQLQQVLLNLCVNARDAMPGGGALTIAAENVTLDAQFCGHDPQARPGPSLLLRVTDTGTGIPAADLDRIFEPFFTTKEPGHGTGLGLSTSLGIVKSHGGFIRVESEPGHGSTFLVYLPAAVHAAAPAAAPEPEAELPRGNGQLILLVDDEPNVRLVTQRTLESFGYRVLAAGDGAEALSLFMTQGDQIAAVLTDLMMPVMDGPALIRVLNKISPGLPIVAASGVRALGEAAPPGLELSAVLAKPFTARTLLRTFGEIFSSTAAMPESAAS